MKETRCEFDGEVPFPAQIFETVLVVFDRNPDMFVFVSLISHIINGQCNTNEPVKMVTGLNIHKALVERDGNVLDGDLGSFPVVDIQFGEPFGCEPLVLSGTYTLSVKFLVSLVCSIVCSV